MENFLVIGKGILAIYSILLFVLVLHEIIHLVFVKIFNKKLIKMSIHPFGGKVVYENDHQYAHILCISAAPNVILPIIGGAVLYIGEGFYIQIFSIICTLNVLNFIPLTGDGSAMFYSLWKWREAALEKGSKP